MPLTVSAASPGTDGASVRPRVLGSIAYRLHCPRNLYLFEDMARALTDIGFAAENQQVQSVQPLFAGLGYSEDRTIGIVSEGSRYVVTGSDGKLNVDVFKDELVFCHRIPLKAWLAIDGPTIPVTDLLLEKMQIVEINLEELEDTSVPLLEQDLAQGSTDRELVDLGHLTSLLCSDWGFYYTVTVNLATSSNSSTKRPGAHRRTAT